MHYWHPLFQIDGTVQHISHNHRYFIASHLQSCICVKNVQAWWQGHVPIGWASPTFRGVTIMWALSPSRGLTFLSIISVWNGPSFTLSLMVTGSSICLSGRSAHAPSRTMVPLDISLGAQTIAQEVDSPSSSPSLMMLMILPSVHIPITWGTHLENSDSSGTMKKTMSSS